MLSLAAIPLVIALFGGCGKTTGSSNSSTSVSQPASNVSSQTAGSGSEKAVAPEKNPAGDIPDTQAFVKYASSDGGYELQVPEGWARTTGASSAQFVDKFDGVKVDLSSVSYTLSANAINQNVIPNLIKNGRAVSVSGVKVVKLKGGSAVEVSFTSNSDPDSVTNKQVRLEDKSYYFINNGKMAALTVWAPQGADNVDQWNFISNSFKWN